MKKKAINNSDEICKFLTINGLPPKLLYPFEEDLESYFIRTIKNEGEVK
jgi:ABC-2 type transport system ATP-binding protein